MPYKSPFEPILRERGAVYGELGDISVPLCVTDSAREYETLTEGGAVLDMPWRGVIEMTGRDRGRFLHGMCTNDVTKLQPGQGCMAAIVNRQGKMVAELVVRATKDALLLEVDRSNLQGTIGALQKFIVADDVAMRESKLCVMGFYGPQALAGKVPADLNPFGFFESAGALVCKNPFFGYDLLLNPSRALEPEVLFPADAPYAGFEAYEHVRIEKGWPRWGADMGPDVLPMEAGLEPIAISYTKGCYIGQEVIQRVKTYSEPPKMLVQLVCDASEVKPHAAIHVDEATVGNVTSACYSPALGRTVALGYVRKEFKLPGTKVHAAGVPATVGPLPWQFEPGVRLGS